MAYYLVSTGELIFEDLVNYQAGMNIDIPGETLYVNLNFIELEKKGTPTYSPFTIGKNNYD